MGVGLLAAWSTIWNFTLLVWTKPQWDAKRVNVRKRRIWNGVPQGPLAHESSHLNGDSCPPDTDGKKPLSTSCGTSEQEDRDASSHVRDRRLQRKVSSTAAASSLDNQTDTPKGTKQQLEYYWQDYPENDSFLTRLSWAFDIASTFRMTGWNWAISCLPPYRPPPYTTEGVQLPLSALPNRSKEGYTRTVSRRTLLLERFVFEVVPNYVLVDFCAVVMTQDPYFLLGPEHPPGLLPPHLAALHPALLALRRTALSFLAVLSALRLAFGFGALCLCGLLPPALGFRAHPWHVPSAVGSFTQVLDRGLAGFWGAWWHQTFRFAFEAPTRWLLARQEGKGEKKEEGGTTTTTATPNPNSNSKRRTSSSARLAGTAIAFLQSGLLHAAGSYSTVPATQWWRPPLFFALAGVGSALQRRLVASLPSSWTAAAAAPRWVRRLGNLIFCLAWLAATSWLLVDDFSRCGLWLWEPVPVSLFRALGYGPPQDLRVWRYDTYFLPHWHSGPRWWEKGFAI